MVQLIDIMHVQHHCTCAIVVDNMLETALLNLQCLTSLTSYYDMAQHGDAVIISMPILLQKLAVLQYDVSDMPYHQSSDL